MENSEQVSIAITLSPTQVDEVVRAAAQSRAPSISTLIADSLGAPLEPAGRAGVSASANDADAVDEESQVGGYLPIGPPDPRLSRSLLRGLSLLTCFGHEGSARGIVEIAHDAGMSPSTAHRYASTLVELGLLERDPKSRKYRLRAV
jgi:IclR helix-turn-helix domain